jgi:ferritin-like metal-binding protein YciE
LALCINCGFHCAKVREGGAFRAGKIPSKESLMPVKTPKETFVTLLSHVRENTEKATKFYEEIGQIAQDPEIKEALESRAFVSKGVLEKLDQCFKLIGEKPVKMTGRLQEIFVEDFRKEVNEIQSPIAKKIFVLAKLIHLTHLRIGEYVALIAAADVTGNFGVGVLLESCLADKMAFMERNRRILRKLIETKAVERKAMEHVAA